MLRHTSLAACAWLASSVALAQQSPDEVRRRELLDRGIAASAAGDHARALDLGTQAGRLRLSPSLRFFLGEQHEFLSREPGGAPHVLDALVEAESCLRELDAPNPGANVDRTRRDCTTLRDRVGARVARLRVRVEGPSDGVSVRVNDRDLPRASWGEAVPVLPGEAVVEASAPGRGVLRQDLHANAGATAEVRVAWPQGERAAPGGQRGSGAAAPPTTPPREYPATHDEGTPTLRVVGWVTVGLGVAAGVFGAVQWIRSNSTLDDARNGAGSDGMAWARYAGAVNGAGQLSADDVCARASGDAASADAATVRDFCASSRTQVTTAWAFGIGGVALTAIGVTMVLVSGGTSRAAARVEATPILGATVGGASLRVRF